MQKKQLTKFNTHSQFKKNNFRIVAIDENFLNLMKSIYKENKLEANIILNGRWQNAFFLRLRTIQGCLPIPLLSKIVLKMLASARRQEKEVKPMQIRKQKLKCLQMTLLSTEKMPRKKKKKHYRINKFSKVMKYKKTYKNQLYFYITAMSM